MKLHRISVLSKVLNVKYCTVGGQKKVRGSGIGDRGGGGGGGCKCGVSACVSSNWLWLLGTGQQI